ncbi:MAG: AraC family transcriptional regulator, partial [Gammaproteobacteria bacterium]|nr:AraC family transcriptional regulator [Gammaproteobacteria bacterium]
ELAQQNRRVAVELERLIVTLLLAGQPHHSQSRANECASVPKSVRRAEAFIAEHALEPLHVSDIAAAAGVADIALSCGFVNLGRYARVYREKFGEAPSETLRKASPQRG